MSDPLGAENAHPTLRSAFDQLLERLSGKPLQALYSAYGDAISSWAIVEDAFLAHLVRLSGANEQIIRREFHQRAGFGSRSKLLAMALAERESDDSRRNFLLAALTKARRYSAVRNALAHGYATNMWLGTPRWADARHPEREGFDVPQLEAISARFVRLGFGVYLYEEAFAFGAWVTIADALADLGSLPDDPAAPQTVSASTSSHSTPRSALTSATENGSASN